ncbi:MAG TPA: hypothetical protein VMN76_05890 [Acidobacteriota bacterium]|nr:hypothetical protein [Acidobacteriota bacterium]
MTKGLILLAMLLFPGVCMAEGYERITERFFGYLEQGRTDEAIDLLSSTNEWVGANTDQVIHLKDQLARLSNLVGEYLFHEMILEQRVGSRYAHLIYLVGYDRQPLRFELKVYRPGDQWRLQGVSFDANLSDDVEKLANQRILE